MGAGKSTVGEKLAEVLQYSFLDTDSWIEKKEQKRISEIFEKQGEAYFRSLETECIKQLVSENEGKVISVGGGLPIRKENRILLKQLGIVVYLKATPEIIYERLKEDQSRPLLRTKNPKEKIREMMEEREVYYKEAAHVILNIENKSVEEIIREILMPLG